MKSNRNLSRAAEGRRLGNVALIAFMLGSLLLLSLLRAKLSPIGKTGDAIKAEEQRAMAAAKEDSAAVEMPAAHQAPSEEEEEETRPNKPTDDSSSGNGGGGAAIAAVVGGDERASRPVCYESSRRSDTCEAAGDVRVVGRAQTVLVSPLDREWKVKPYCRKHDAFALAHVKEWTLRPLSSPAAAGEPEAPPPPRCTVNSSATAFVLSTGGFTGNLFHDYTDVLIPAFITARRLAGDVQLLVSSHKPWWTTKYLPVLQQLSRHEIVDADADPEVRCFPRVVVGPTFHRELGIDPPSPPSSPNGVSMPEFRAMLRGALGLERATAAPSGDRWDIRRRPRLLIIARRGSRRLLNERAMADMASSLGFDVRAADPEASAGEVARFARLVNSADVMVGVHGDGLTNMVFLPAGAVLVQVVPYGAPEWLARATFREPAAGMEVHYLEYLIQKDETTLADEYGEDDPVMKDPAAIHRKGWDAMKEIYLDKQDVRPHLGRLKNTFVQALKLLPHGRQNAAADD